MRDLAVVLALGLALPASAADIRAGPTNYRQAVKQLRPGDTLRLDPGIYRDGIDVHDLVGTPRKPIAIVGARGKQRSVLWAQPRRNTISIANAAFVRIADLDLVGRGLATDGVKAEGHARFAHDIVLERLNISGYSRDQQNVGISTKCPAWNWVIRDVVISDVGTGLYLGNSDGSAPFVRGLIERTTVTATIGYSLQIKHQLSWPDSLEVAPAVGQTVIRYSTFAKNGANAVADLARPNVLLGHWPLAGRGARDRYLVYGNLFLDNPTEALLQAEGNAAIYNNVFVNRVGPAIAIREHNDRPREIALFHNTIVARDQGILLRGPDPAYRQVVAGNAVFAAGVTPQVLATGNFVRPFADADRHLGAVPSTGSLLDLVPRGSSLIDRQNDASRFVTLPDATLDFDRKPRRSAVFGAYAPGAAADRRRMPR